MVSGINHGSNAATNILYSGTMSAAIEGAIESIPSIGFSLLDHDSNADLHWDHCKNPNKHGDFYTKAIFVNMLNLKKLSLRLK